jgi:hypothetical protein
MILGDLMFCNQLYEQQMKEKYPDLTEDFDDEFFWYIDDEIEKLESLGFEFQIKQFSDLSWGIYGLK